jgi:phage gpG-like protein
MLGPAISVADFGRLAAGPGGVPGVPRPLPAIAAQAIGVAMAADVRRRFQTGTDPAGRPWTPLRYPRPRGGSKPLLDTGVLRNSITHRPEADGASVGTAIPYAPLMHFGGKVVPKRAKYLTIPLTKEAARAGSPRAMRNLEFVPKKARGGKVRGWLVEQKKTGRGKKKTSTTVFHWVCVTDVEVPARPFMGLSAQGLGAIDAIIAEMAMKNWLQFPSFQTGVTQGALPPRTGP